ncbi:MAG: H-NS histone family protein [Chromatiaceae bacterium]|jgi:DNA-binding protein H-NS|nr:H-NS histone family protein [Chromatiaceae bacterium]MBP8197331.1 H-NS histone family protein [Chromatiaceae bacterium]
MPPTENDTDLRSLNAQITALQAQYDEIFKAEKAPIIKEINVLIKKYKIRPYELNFNNSANGGSRGKYVLPLIRDNIPRLYRSRQGKVWNGIGRRPEWVQKMLERGGDLEDYRVKL